jgi:hypothetical protein
MLLLWSATPMQAFNGGYNFTAGPVKFYDDDDDILLLWFAFLRGE